MIRVDARVGLGVALALAAFAAATTAIEDTDAWTHLALGRDLVQLGRFPATERFTVPGGALPYDNPEWLFGVVLYLAYLGAGYAGVVLLKAALVTATFVVLFRDALVGADRAGTRTTSAAVALLGMAGALAMARHRFVERPDVALMLFLALTIHALNRSLTEDRARLLWLMPLVQVLWVNTHPSIVVGVVPYLAVLGGGLAQRAFTWRFGRPIPGTPSPRQLRTIAIVFALVLVGSLVNPYGYGPFLAPFRLVTAAWLRHEVIELQPPDLRHYPGVAIVTAALAISFLARWRRPPLVSILLTAPFVYLAFSARRFVFLLAVVGIPLLARDARAAVARLPDVWSRRLSVPATVLAVLGTIVPASLAAASVPPFVDPFRVPGFGTNLIGVPEGALAYLDRVEVRGPVFNVFHWGGYITWRDYPRRRPFVDGRGYLPPGLLDTMMAVRRDAVRLRELSVRYAFDVAIVDYPRNVMVDETPDIDLGLVSHEWALVYWDDLAMVYLKRTPARASVIARDEYRDVKPAMGAGFLRKRLADAARAPAVIAELQRNIAGTRSSTGHALLGFVYNEIGLYERALAALREVRDFPLGSNVLNAELAMGFAATRLGDLPQALAHYERALALDEDPLTLHNTGLVREKIGDDRGAARAFARALAKDANLAPTYPALMRVTRRLGQGDRARARARRYVAALAHGEAEAHFRRGVKLYFEGQLEPAAAEFRDSIKTHPRSAAARSNLGFAYYDLGRLEDAFAEEKGALDIDPGFANAHYALALIQRGRGDHVAARAHFEAYLTLEPRGYWARRAQAALGELRAR